MVQLINDRIICPNMLCDCTAHFDEQLLDHIASRRNAEAMAMLNEDLAKASADCRGMLLHLAATVGNEDIAKHLIDLGSPIESRGPGAKTPLMLAVEYQRKPTVRVLLDAGADINLVDANGKSALHKALHSTNDFEIVEAVLLRAKAETPATEELIEKLLAAGCAFPCFVLLRDFDVLKTLLQRGFDINEQTCMKRSALHFAALIKDLKSAELLVAQGADVNAADSCEAGPLYYAAKGADTAIVRFLLDHGADPTPDVEYIDQSPLYACFIVRENDAEQVRECAELLLERDADNFPLMWRPCSLVQQVQWCYEEILQTTRLNCLVANQAVLDAGRYPNFEDGQHLTTFAELREYYDKCREILEVEVVEKMTVLKLLFLDYDREMRFRALDQAFVRQVEQFCAKPELKENFSYYARIMRNQIAKAARAVKLEKRGELVVCDLFKCDYNLLCIFARQVVAYLSEHDLEQLGRV